MTTVDLTKDTFEAQVSGDGITLVDFWASWCGPCRAFAPVYEAAAGRAENADITFGTVNTEEQPELGAALRISSIPTLMAFREGVLVFRQSGALPAHSLAQLIEAVRSLDMEDVRRQLAEAKAAGTT